MTSTAPSAGTLAHLPTDWAARHTDWGLGAHVGDQTALLEVLPQEILARLILPLGEFDKESVQEIAQDIGCAE